MVSAMAAVGTEAVAVREVYIVARGGSEWLEWLWATKVSSPKHHESTVSYVVHVVLVYHRVDLSEHKCTESYLSLHRQ